MGQAHPSTKRKSSEKADHLPKKPKVTGPNSGETLSKLPPKPSPGIGKGLMKGPIPVVEERPVLPRKYSSYALK